MIRLSVELQQMGLSTLLSLMILTTLWGTVRVHCRAVEAKVIPMSMELLASTTTGSGSFEYNLSRPVIWIGPITSVGHAWNKFS